MTGVGGSLTLEPMAPSDFPDYDVLAGHAIAELEVHDGSGRHIGITLSFHAPVFRQEARARAVQRWIGEFDGPFLGWSGTER